ncbi:MAG TPA: DUF6600 domain-containing protein [Pyrinomonadaceae bacterium]|nr:DUF6600 domain-containing protein [Pyrinomonadaceae bacterium]
MNRVRLWPHAVLIFLGVAIVAASAVLLWRKYEQTASAKTLPNPARIERVDGQVAINHSLDSNSNQQWFAATMNAPVSVGDRLYTQANSRTDIAFTGRNFATVDPNTSLDILDLTNQRTQVALREGSALFDVGSLGSGQLFEVATPCGAVDLQQPGMYRVALDDNGNATVTAFSGQAQIVGQAGTGTITKGEELTIPCGGAGSASISRVDYDQAGTYLDSYYRHRYPRTYDGRYRSYYTYLEDPDYYDPYNRYNSYRYVSEYMPGLYDLDDYGDWSYLNDYGYAWHPRVDTGWAPYEYGYWTMDYPYGLTWVSTEPWGYAPYHYGRWTYLSNQWFWIPESTYAYPTYSPALTAFIPLGDSSIAWVPLGPGDPYTSWYYDPYWQPVYYTNSPVVVERLVNVYVPNAVTVIPIQDFGQIVDPRIITRVDSKTIVKYKPVLDPLTVASLRQAAFRTRELEQRVAVSEVVKQRINNKTVITTAAPAALPFKRDLASALKVQQASGQARNQKLKLNDQRAATTQGAPSQAPNIADEQARERQMAELARQVARGDRGARQQMQELRRQQAEQQRLERVNAQRAQGERVRQEIQPRKLRAPSYVPKQQPMKPQEPPRRSPVAPPPQRIEQRAAPAPVRRPPISQPQPRPTKPEVHVQQPRAQAPVMTAPRAVQPRPRIEYKGPPVKTQPQAQPQPQAVPHAQPKAEQQKAGGPPAAKGGRKKP